MHNSREAIDIMWRSNEMRGEVVRCAWIVFLTGLCEKETEAGRDVFFWEKNMELPHRGGAGGIPQKTLRCKPTRTALHFGMCYLMHDLQGLDVHFLPAEEQSAPQWCRLRPGSPSGGNGRHGIVVPLQCFLLLPCHHVLQAGVAGVFSALHHICKAW